MAQNVVKRSAVKNHAERNVKNVKNSCKYNRKILSAIFFYSILNSFNDFWPQINLIALKGYSRMASVQLIFTAILLNFDILN